MVGSAKVVLRAACWIGAGLCVPAALPATARARPAADGPVRVLVLIDALDAPAEADAARLYQVWSQKLGKDPAHRRVTLAERLGQAAPAEPFADAAKLFQGGRKAYDNLELARAIKRFSEALAAMEANLSTPLDRTLYGQVLTYLGAAVILGGEEQRGLSVFHKLLVFQPGAELDPMVFPPSLTQSFAQVAAEVKAQGRGSLDVQSEPAGAAVWVDGRLVGFSPLVIDGLTAGGHRVRLMRRGLRPAGAQVRIRAGAREALAQALEPLPGSQQLQSWLGQLRLAAADERFPAVVEQLLGWAEAGRLLYLQAARRGSQLQITGWAYGAAPGRRLAARRLSLDTADDGWPARADGFFAALLAGEDGVLANAGQSLAEAGGGSAVDPLGPALPPEPAAAGSDSVWRSWWLWTAVAVVVAGGTGLALGLTLGGGRTPNAGDVVFRF